MREPSPLQKFAELLAQGEPDPALADLLPGLAAAQQLEEARRLLRQCEPTRSHLLQEITKTAERARQIRQSAWQNDTSKLRLRMRYQRTGAAAALLPSAFLAAVESALRGAGLELALSLEKRPRPRIQLGHPLPLGAEGLGEYLEVVLAEAPAEDPLPALNRAATDGLVFDALEPLPDHATPVLDLSIRSEWIWPCPEALRMEAGNRVAAFLAADSFRIEKTGKAEGRKQVKQVEVRDLVLAMAWEGSTLRLSTRIEPGQALHPARLLGGILGLEPSAIHGLVRTSIELAPDPRLDQGDRFEPKLKNMFEDAVLLKAGPNLQIVEEDDDEPLRLG